MNAGGVLIPSMDTIEIASMRHEPAQAAISWLPRPGAAVPPAV